MPGDTPLRFLCVQHNCPNRQHCLHYRADVAGLPVMVCQIPMSLSRCRDFLRIPPGAKTKEIR